MPMLYTVRPLERVYAPPNTFEEAGKSNAKNDVKETEPQYREIMLPNGRIVTRRDGENFIIERINSTDMLDYLNEDYSPGKHYLEKGKNR